MVEDTAHATKMYQTIQEQPAILREAIALLDATADRAAALLAEAKRVYLMGMGTSYHTAIVGEHLFRLAGVDAYATTNFDFSVYPRALGPDDVVVAISHRGGLRYGSDVIVRAKSVGAHLIGVTGHDTRMQGPEVVLETCSQEICAAGTKNYTSGMLALGQVAVHLADLHGVDVATLRHDIDGMADTVQSMLACESIVRVAAEHLARSRRALLIGAGPNLATAREGALKLKETCFIVAEGFELETFLHGGLPAIAAGDLAVLIVPDGPSLDRLRDAARALQMIGAILLLICDERIVDRFFADEILVQPDILVTFPATHELLSPIPAIIPLQLLSTYTAALLGTDPDNFRKEDPIYKAAVDSYNS